MDIPAHLSELRRDRRGLPVPFINQWGELNEASIELRLDPCINELAIYYRDDPTGVPDFTMQNIQRQREVMWGVRCQVCYREVRGDARLALADMSIDRVHIDGLGERVVVTEPWLCPDCAEFAVGTCPALIRRRRDENLLVYEVEDVAAVRMTTSYGWVDGPLKRLTRKRPAAMWAKLILPANVLLDHTPQRSK